MQGKNVQSLLRGRQDSIDRLMMDGVMDGVEIKSAIPGLTTNLVKKIHYHILGGIRIHMDNPFDLPITLRGMTMNATTDSAPSNYTLS